MPLKRLIACIILLLSITSGHAQADNWFRNDGVSIDMRGLYPQFKTDTSLTFIINTRFKRAVNFKTMRVRSSIENSSFRFRAKSHDVYADTIDLGATSMPGIYEILIDKIRDSILIKKEIRNGDTISIRYADTIAAWYNVLVFKKTTLKDTFNPIYRKAKSLFSDSCWGILDSMMTKMNTDSVNRNIGDLINNNKKDSIKSVVDSICHCNEKKMKYAQYAVVINNSTESFYKLNSITVIIDSSCSAHVLPLDTILARFSIWLLDTSSRPVDSVTLDKFARKKLYNEIMSTPSTDVDVIYSLGYIERYLRRNNIEIGYWRKKYFVSTKKGAFFRQIHFAGKEPVKIKEGEDQPVVRLDVKSEKQQPLESHLPMPVNTTEKKTVAVQKEAKAVPTQSLDILTNENEIFKEARQFSSLVIVGEQLWSFGERCNEVAKFDPDGNYIGSTGLPIDNAIQIEGACSYGKHVLLLDETPHKTGVYFLDTSSFSAYKILLPEFDYSDDVMGVEGIAVNAEDNKCYILREKNSANKSLVKQYDIRKDGSTFKLDYLEGKDIVFSYPQADLANFNCRYTDLYYSENQLYLLGCRYNEDEKFTSKYYIDKISHHQRTGVFDPLNLAAPEDHYVDLTRETRDYIHSYETNLEGLVLTVNGIFYIIADNWQGDKKECTFPAKKPTLFFRFTREVRLVK